jgi:arylsulfatase A-like enzyme
MTDVLTRQGLAFIDRMARTPRTPFLLTIAPFAPHYPYAAAPRDRKRFRGLKAPRVKSWNEPTKNPPRWLGHRKAMTPAQTAEADLVYRKRVRSLQAVNLMLRKVRARLGRHGMAKKTYVIFTSDNGLHAGEHRLAAGKMTAFDTDIRVPFVAVGPDVPKGKSMDQMTANIDLAPTFMRLGGAPVPRTVDGHGFIGLLHGQEPRTWRDAILVEHHGPTTPVGDPDRQGGMSGNPPTYDAIRTRYSTWVEYENGDRELYDLRNDPAQLVNVAGQVSPATEASLHRTLVRLRDCHHTLSCWRASMR